MKRDKNLKLFRPGLAQVVRMARHHFRADSRSTWRADFHLIDGMSFKTPLTIAQIRARLGWPDAVALGIGDSEDGRLRGFLLARQYLTAFHLCHVVVIDRIAVLPDDRRLGVGRALVEGLMEHLGYRPGGFHVLLAERDTLSQLFFQGVGFNLAHVAHGRGPGGQDVYRFARPDDREECKGR
jgi:ribosomal protein S18 acetylase RimI-like enzyme